MKTGAGEEASLNIHLILRDVGVGSEGRSWLLFLAWKCLGGLVGGLSCLRLLLYFSLGFLLLLVPGPYKVLVLFETLATLGFQRSSLAKVSDL